MVKKKPGGKVKPKGRQPNLSLTVSEDERAQLREAAGDFPPATWAKVKLFEVVRATIAAKRGKP